MKKAISALLVVVMLLSLGACGTKELSPEEKLEPQAVAYMEDYIEEALGDMITGKPTITYTRRANDGSNVWAMMGTAEFVMADTGKTLSYDFGIKATYNETTEEFEFSHVKFDFELGY